MTKSFKMILLEALLELEGLSVAPEVSQLAFKSWEVMQRRKPLLSDLPREISQLEDGKSAQWLRYWQANPINAWLGGNRAPQTTPFFRLNEGRFQFSDPAPEAQRKNFASLVQELVDYRLAQYDARPSSSGGSNVIPFPPRLTASVELPYFPNLKIACGHFRSGRTDVEEHRTLPTSYGQLDPSRHFIARASGSSMDGGKRPIRDGDYLLLELVSPSNAGSITGTTMAIERQDQASGDNQYLLRVVTKDTQGQHILRANNPAYEDIPSTEEMRTLARLKAVVDPLDISVRQAFAREEIPKLFGESFNPGSWNVGHVVLNEKRVHILLVTLNKQGKAEEHRYHDHWIDEQTFHWQSQNSTTPASKRGQEIINHEAKGIDIHLFVRGHKLKGPTAAPFVYHGRVKYRSHTGSSPMSVIFTVDSASDVDASSAS